MTNVLIIGGGIIGLSIARELRKKDVENIIILEKNSMCGMEASNAAAGMLAPQAEAEKADDFYSFCCDSRDLYTDFAAELLTETGVDIELDKTGTLYLAFNEKDANDLEERFNWQIKEFQGVEKLTARQVLSIEPNISPNVIFGLFFPQDWQVENRKIIQALSHQLSGVDLNHGRNFVAAKSVSFVSAEAISLLFEENRVSGVETELGTFSASTVIIASGAWTGLIKDKLNLLTNLLIKPVRGQMIAFSYSDKLFRHVIYSRRGYVVPRKDCRILIGATTEDAGFEDHTTDAGTSALLNTAFEISSQFRNLNVSDKWSGLRPYSGDGLPVLGSFPEIENLFVATGHFRNGILLAPLTAKLLADKIAEGTDSKYLDIFSPRRFRNLAVGGQ